MDPQLARLLIYALDVLSWIIIARVLISWVIRDPTNVIVRVLGGIVDPLLRPLSRFLTFGGFDAAPIVVLLLIHGAQRLIAQAAGG